ncbi:MAG: choice-of-anchor D domain-containing protein [Pseudomonadota bacterium]
MTSPARLLAFTALLAGCQDYEVQAGLPDLALSSRTLDCEEVRVGTWATVGVALENVGKGDLHVDSVALEPDASPEFSLVDSPVGTVGPGEQVLLSARYQPDEVGQDYTRITVVSDDPDEPEVSLELLGFGVQPFLEVDPETLWFGDVASGDTRTLSVTLSAAGTGTLRVQELSLEEVTAPFSVALPPDVTLPWPLATGHSFEVEVTFAPLDESPQDTHLLVASNDPESPLTGVRLLGNAEGTGVNEPPIVEITDPNWGAYLEYGQPVSLQGVVVDIEDGPTNLACIWYVNGALAGTAVPSADGAVSLTTTALPLGDVTIELRAIDSEGATGSDDVAVEVWDTEEPLEYTLSGGITVFEYWAVDDDIVIELNGSPIFSDTDRLQNAHPPLEFTARVGDTLRLRATDEKYCKQELDTLYLHWGTGQAQLLTPGVCRSACDDDACYDPTYEGPWPNVFFDEAFSIEIP